MSPDRRPGDFIDAATRAVGTAIGIYAVIGLVIIIGMVVGLLFIAPFYLIYGLSPEPFLAEHPGSFLGISVIGTLILITIYGVISRTPKEFRQALAPVLYGFLWLLGSMVLVLVIAVGRAILGI